MAMEQGLKGGNEEARPRPWLYLNGSNEPTGVESKRCVKTGEAPRRGAHDYPVLMHDADHTTCNAIINPVHRDS